MSSDPETTTPPYADQFFSLDQRFLAFKEDSRSRVEHRGEVRKIWYDAEAGHKEAEITRIAHRICPGGVVGVEGEERTKEGWVVIRLNYVKESLETFLKKRGQLPESSLVPIAYQLMSTLHSLHSHGLAHRDLNVANIVVSSSETIQLIDFEISHYPPDFPNTDCMSTVDCASPELLKEILIGVKKTGTDPYKNDWWAAGKVVVDLIGGMRGKTWARMKQELVEEKIRQVTLHYPVFRALLQTCLQVDPTHRGEAVPEAICSLQSYVPPPCLNPPPSNPVPGSKRPSRRKYLPYPTS